MNRKQRFEKFPSHQREPTALHILGGPEQTIKRLLPPNPENVGRADRFAMDRRSRSSTTLRPSHRPHTS